MRVLFRWWERGDWVQVVVDGKVIYEGHSIPSDVYNDILEDAGVEVENEYDVDEE